MEAKIRDQHSGPRETERRERRSWFRLSLGVRVGLVALLVSFPGSLGFALPSPRHEDGVEDQSTAKAEIPFELYSDNLIIVKATIGPIKNVNMILDTGTSPTAITKAMADRLKLRGETESVQTLNGTIQAQSVILPPIQIGPLNADSLRVIVQDLSFMERSLGVSLAGIAGLDILSTGSFTIDYRRRKIAFGPIAASEKAVRFETRVPFLTIKAKIERTGGPLIGRFGDLGIGGLSQPAPDNAGAASSRPECSDIQPWRHDSRALASRRRVARQG